jgi:acetyl-CoA decarbonylase/synthase complex subunit gamma
MKINSPLEAYKYLPATNCGECGEQHVWPLLHI